VAGRTDGSDRKGKDNQAMADEKDQNPNTPDAQQPAVSEQPAAPKSSDQTPPPVPETPPQANGTPGDPPGEDRQPTLEEIIALQRAKLRAKIAGDQNPPTKDAPASEETSQPPQATTPQEAATEQATEAPTAEEIPAEAETQVAVAVAPTTTETPPPARRRVSLLHVAVLLNTALMLFAVGGLFHILGQGPTAKDIHGKGPNGLSTQVVVIKTPESGNNTVASDAAATTQPTQPARQTARGEHLAVGETSGQVISWQQAETAFAQKDYPAALSTYGRLLESTQRIPSEAVVGQFFQMRTAQCLVQIGRTREGRELLLTLMESSSPLLRAVANYEAALLDLRHGQFMQARMKLYAALACLGALETPSGLERDCDFQVARALTQEATSLFASASPVEWNIPPAIDPLGGLDAHQLRAQLSEGLDRMGQAMLGPMVWKIEGGSQGQQWMVVCVQSPLEEVLTKFASEADLEVRWNSIDPQIRQRPVTLLLSGVSQQRLAEVACGQAGLLARLTGDEVIVHNPAASTTLSGQRELLTAEAVSAWRRFFLRASDDPRMPLGYYALAALEATAGDAVAALQDTAVTAERFPNHEVAAKSLLLGARIRTQLRDYNGARADLLRLLDRYPNCPSADQAYLNLGRVSAEAGQIEEAITAYNKLYYLNLSGESRTQACLGLGRCHFLRGRFDQAVEWLVQCRKSPGDLNETDLDQARMLLGRSSAELGNLSAAQQSFQDVLTGRPPSEMFVDAGLRLSEVLIRQGKTVAALTILRELETREMEDPRRQELFLLMAWALRDMSLPERAAAYLRGKIATIADPRMQMRLTMELARCLLDDGDSPAALATLAEALPKAPAGPKTQKMACFLAEIALKMGKLDQAVSVSQELLATSCPPEIRQQALEILAASAVLQKDYRKAAEAYSGMLAAKSTEAKAP